MSEPQEFDLDTATAINAARIAAVLDGMPIEAVRALVAEMEANAQVSNDLGTKPPSRP